MLQVSNLVSCIGRVEIIKGLSFHVREKEIVTLIGANGAGKSTLLNTIAGLIHPKQGEIRFDGRSISRLSPMQTAPRGLSLVPEGRQLFASLSVMDNLLLGSYHFYSRSAKDRVNERFAAVFDLFPLLKERGEQLAGTLSGGEQQMLAIARSLMSDPKMILLDEPSMGLAPRIVDEIFRTIDALRQQGLTVLLVEQNARMALDLADRGYVIETGLMVMEGDCRDLKQNREIERAYLGKGYQEIWE